MSEPLKEKPAFGTTPRVVKLSRSDPFCMAPAPKTLVKVIAGLNFKNSFAAIAPNCSGSISPKIVENWFIDVIVFGTKAGPLLAIPIIPPGTLNDLDTDLCEASISLSKNPGDLNVCSAIYNSFNS